MSSPNKRSLKDVFKEAVECDSSKRQRSSLQVNVSYSSDSGHESLRRTSFENTDIAANDSKYDGDSIARRTRSRNVRNESIKSFNKPSRGISSQDEKNVQASPTKHKKKTNFSNIQQQEQALNSNCEILKKAILMKTKEIFEKQSELSQKTRIVLDSPRYAMSSIQNVRRTLKSVTEDTENENRVITNPEIHNPYLLTNSSKTNTNCDNHLDITTTPKAIRSTFKLPRKCKPSKKQLFAQKEETPFVAVHELRENNSNLEQYDTNVINSPILSGSNRMHNKYILRNLCKSRNQKREDDVQTTLDNFSLITSEDEYHEISINLPIVCSTLIEDDGKGEKKSIAKPAKSNGKSKHNKNESKENAKIGSVPNSPCNISRQENVHVLVDKPQSTVTINTGKGIHITGISTQNNASSMELTTVQNNIVLQQQHIKNTNQLNTKDAEHNTVDTNVSNKNVSSSLEVNTSLDGLHKDENHENYQTESIQVVLQKNPRSCEIPNGCVSPCKTNRESINTIRSSLHVNTSKDSAFKFSIRATRHESPRSNKSEERETDPIMRDCNNFRSLENLSLAERLKNIPTRGGTLKLSYLSNKDMQHSNEERMKDRNSSGPSFIEATPIIIPTCLRKKNSTRNLSQECTISHSLPSAFCETHKTVVCNERIIVNNKLCKVNSRNLAHEVEKQLPRDQQDTILNDTSYCKSSSSHGQIPVIIDETFSESLKDRTGIGTEKSTKVVSKIRRKKKLYPLRETSQLISLTPLEDLPGTSESIGSIKKRRKRYAKFVMQKTKKQQSKEPTIDQIQNEAENVDSEHSAKAFNSSAKEKKVEKKKKLRKVVSKKIVIKKFPNEDILQKLQQNKKVHTIDQEDDTNRNSLNDFQERKVISARKPSKGQKIIIVATGLSRSDKCLVKSVVQSLGNAKLDETVTRYTTHVVSTGVRTVNLLHGIIRGCWLVSLEWVLLSLENNQWLNPEQFEMKHFSVAVLENRRDRQLFGAFYTPELFATCGLIHVRNNTNPPAPILKDLIKAAGGWLTDDLQIAKVIIGEGGVKESWVLDSITTGELQQLKEYRKNKIERKNVRI